VNREPEIAVIADAAPQALASIKPSTGSVVNNAMRIATAAVLAAAAAAVLLWLNHRDDQPAGTALNLPAAQRPADANSRRHDPALSAPEMAASQPPDAGRSAFDRLAERFREQYGPQALARYRNSLAARYAHLGEAMNLSQDEVSRILDQMASLQGDLNSQVNEILNREISSGTRNTGATIVEVLYRSQLTQQAQETVLRNALGSKYAQWEEYNIAPQVRGSVSNLQTLFEISDIRPLTQAQSDALIATLTAEQLRINHETASINQLPQGRGQQDSEMEEQARSVGYSLETNRRLVLAAARHLDAQQLAAYEHMLDNDMKRAIASKSNAR
jgi:hypothetical protein